MSMRISKTSRGRNSNRSWENASPEITFLLKDPKTGAEQLMMRGPANFYAARHWHTANETHTVVFGDHEARWRREREGALGPGGYNYMPSKMVHEGWVGPEGNLLFITVDGPWDIHIMDAK